MRMAFAASEYAGVGEIDGMSFTHSPFCRQHVTVKADPALPPARDCDAYRHSFRKVRKIRCASSIFHHHTLS